MSPSTLRAYVACDVANISKSCKNEFGNSAKVNFKTLARVIPTIINEEIDQKLVAYIVTSPKYNHQPFESALKGFGYDVRKRFMRYDKGMVTPFRTDWDVGITIDAIANSADYDVFVLVSGDGDFAMLLEYLRQLGKRTIAISFRGSSSHLLHDAADQLFYFSEDILLR